MDILADLSQPQRLAVTHGDGPLLVLAGAGSGKTRVITRRVAYLIAERGVPPWRILGVTFTNKAAGEMRDRVRSLLDDAAARVWLGTFHATCARLIRQHPEAAGVDPGFTIYDDDDTRTVVTRVVRDLGLGTEFRSVREVQARIDRAKQDGKDAEDLPQRGRDGAVRAVWTEYRRRLSEANAVDFGDLLLLAVRMLQRNTGLREDLRERFLHILVDEFQDTNAVQYALLKLLVNDRRNLCVVGDDDQSIYSWRGARVRNILGFESDFPGAAVVRLEQNYRSTSRILDSAAAVIARNESRHAKKLWTANDSGESVRVVVAGDEREEAYWVAAAVEAGRAEGRSLRNAAVFYRVNAQSRVIEEALRAYGIPYVVVGGFRFYERAEVKDLLAYLRLVVNPADDTSFLRIVNAPPRGIGKVTVERVVARARERGAAVLQVAADAESIPGIPPAGARALAALARQFARWREGAVAGPQALARRILEDTGYEEALRKARTAAEAESRIQNLKELVGSIGDFVAETEAPTLTAYLEHVSLQTAVDETDTGAERLALMTVHAAKGLEFDDVYVVGLEEDLFPFIRSRDDEDESRDEGVEEERRLCYVAMTRARKRLHLCRAVQRSLFGGSHMNPPSRFLRDLPEECVESVVLPGAGGRRGIVPRDRVSPMGSTAPPPRRSRRPPARSPAADAVASIALAGAPGPGVRVGDRVRHVKFGVGKVREVAPGPRPKLTVEFPNWGPKKIFADFVERA